MKSWVLLIVVVVGISAAATVAVPLLTDSPGASGPKIPAPDSKSRPEGPLPKLVLEEKLTHEFGTMAQETKGSHTWIFRNEGQGPLEVRTLSSTCSCTLAQLGKDSQKVLTIEPGKSAPIELTWDTKKNDGKYGQSAKIGTNDVNRPEVDLAVSGTVRPPVITLPPEGAVNFSAVTNDKTHPYKIVVYSADKPDLKITGLVTSDPKLLTTEVRPLNPDECKELNAPAGHLVTLTLQASPKLGKFNEELVVETDHPRRPKVSFLVQGVVEGPITTAPARVILHDATTKDGGSLDLTIRTRGQANTKFTVASKPEHIDVAIAPMGGPDQSGSGMYRMTVTVPPSTPSGRIQGEVVLHTDNPNAAEVKVPIDVLVRSAD